MKEPRHDDERLAALLEGRLEGPERDELLAYLATADEDFHVFAKTAAVLREMEEEEAAARAQKAGEQVKLPARETLPPSVTGRRRRWGASRVIVPAVLAGLAALVIFVAPGRTPAAGSPVAMAQSLGQGLPEGWTDHVPWTPERGDTEREQNTRAVQSGARLVDLTLAIRAGDPAEIKHLAEDLLARSGVADVPSNPLRQIANQAGDSAALPPLLEQAYGRLTAQLDPAYLQLGGWTEAALLAAHYRDVRFFRSGDTRAMLARAERLTRDVPEGHQAVGRIERAVAGDETPNWPTLTTDLETLMNAIAS
ncbi:hypothetical protein [Longimicrobium sp.]|uniref:hypothetical protein n=1 Tax=Longimicrobium sp. TaxID=2029185 RepID=UPI002E303A23|nr:hypothetical protein [Longimicrobium sp.]HEX6042472.1 hypothetical protein [Longimicrobium sp.]